jgi:O-antigen/teichoic acid export membrane protein
MSLKKNVIANFAGSAWSALMGLAFVPFYIRWMGVESYGIIGVFTALMGMLAVLDLGLSQAMNREMARQSSEEQSVHRMADTARTLEIVYWGIALVVGAIIILLAMPIANYWLNPEQLTRGELQQALWIMGLVIALRWPVALYMGGLNGLQRQVQLNVLLSVVATIQGVGTLAVLWFIAPTIQVFLMWQAVMALAQVIMLRTALWRSIPHAQDGIFNKEVLNEVWHFAAGMTGISLLATILTQLDKLILSKVLTLTEFGYYTFAATVAAVLFRMIGPVFTAYFPRLTELVSRNDTAGVANTYHQGSQLMAVVILPTTFVLAFFSKEILELWTHNPNLVLHASLLVSLLAIGNALNGLMHVPYALQLAHGWTKLAFFQNVVAVIVLAPAIYFSTLRWGAVGAAGVWIGLNMGYLLIGIQVMHRRLLSDDKWDWYIDDVIKPLGAVATLSIFSWLALGENAGTWVTLVVLLTTLIAATIAAIANSNSLRGRVSVRQLWAGNK